MGERVSKALINVMEEMTQIEVMELKIQGAIFTRKCNNLINEKVNYLEGLLQKAAESYNQKIEKFIKNKSEIVNVYKEKLQKLYKEFYLQYVNIQNELQDAKFNQRVIMIKYQNLINKRENETKSSKYIEYTKIRNELLAKLNSAKNSNEYNEIYRKVLELKSPLKDVGEKKEFFKIENDKYKKIIKLCNQKFIECRVGFETQVNKEFLIVISLIKNDNDGIIGKIKCLFDNMFFGAQKYSEILDRYKLMINKIDCEKIITQMRKETIDFVKDILIIKSDLADAKAG